MALEQSPQKKDTIHICVSSLHECCHPPCMAFQENVFPIQSHRTARRDFASLSKKLKRSKTAFEPLVHIRYPFEITKMDSHSRVLLSQNSCFLYKTIKKILSPTSFMKCFLCKSSSILDGSGHLQRVTGESNAIE